MDLQISKKFNVGSLMKLAWSSNSTICSGAGVIHYILEFYLFQKGEWRTIIWLSYRKNTL